MSRAPNVNVTLTEELAEELDKAAKAARVPKSTLVATLLEEAAEEGLVSSYLEAKIRQLRRLEGQ